MKLRQVYLSGYKSIDKAGQTIPLGDITVLLGANGSGKSNLISFFKMLNFMTEGTLKQYVGREGATRLLHYGPKKTESIFFGLDFGTEDIRSRYEIALSYGLPDRLFIGSEKIVCHGDGKGPQEYVLDGRDGESGLKTDPRPVCEVLYNLLSGICFYQFHDTSDTAKIKDRGYVDDARYLRSDGGNLAAFLKMLKEHSEFYRYYDRIIRHIRRIMPQFGDFDLTPVPGNRDYVRLNWRDSAGSDYLFDPGQISDGSLRFMALSALLLQPPDLMPTFIVLDEPELGLHPLAIRELAGLVRSASQKTQVLLATQSSSLINEFLAEDLVVLERDEESQCSLFKKLDCESLKEWLGRYSLSDLWEKNVIGGQP